MSGAGGSPGRRRRRRGGGHLGARRVVAEQVPVDGGAHMAEDRAVAARQDRRELAPLPGERGAADGIDAAVHHAADAAGATPHVDRRAPRPCAASCARDTTPHCRPASSASAASGACAPRHDPRCSTPLRQHAAARFAPFGAAHAAAPSGTLPRVLSRPSCGATVVAALMLLAPAGALAFRPTGVTAAPADTQAGANSNFALHFGARRARARPQGLRHPSAARRGRRRDGDAAVHSGPVRRQGVPGQHAGRHDDHARDRVPDADHRPRRRRAGQALQPRARGQGAGAAGHPPHAGGGRRDPAAVDRHRAPADGGLDSSTDGLPRTSALGPIDINAVDITLFGKAGDPAKGFVSNPTSCAVATTTVDATAYDGTQGSGSASFTPTGLRQARLRPDRQRRPSSPAPRTGCPRCTTVVESPAGPGQCAHRADHPAGRARRPGDDAQPRLPGGASSPKAGARPTPRSAPPRPRPPRSPPRSRAR